ncbi:hypothetical protein KEM54_003832 [Ascosphaera aggregata]|nr:hypothetical protein KEM54_003832 [Ascosphaera aggregata]
MKLGIAVITAFLAKSCCAVPAMAARQVNVPDPSSIGLNINQLDGVLHDLTNLVNIPLDGNSHPLGDLLRQAGINGNKDTRIAGLQANAQSRKFSCDIDLNKWCEASRP